MYIKGRFHSRLSEKGFQRVEAGESDVKINLSYSLHEADLTEFKQEIEKIERRQGI